ncbi:MAG: cytochrome c [Rheinheimera sp.]|nr:MAG: cytochrome c [Rheinheimera sp.]
MRTLMLLTLFGFSLSLSAAPADISRGQVKAAMCAACHGATGISVLPDYPNLAGQKAGYLQQALKAYRDGQRQHQIMAPMAQGLTDQEIADIAAFFAAQQPAPAAKTEAVVGQ